MKKTALQIIGLCRRYQASLYTLADWLSVSGVFVFLAVKTWRRSGDPLIDFPKNLYIAWRMNEGDLLYRNISCWYGSLPHVIEALSFRIFGIGLDTLLSLNLLLLAATLLLLRAVFLPFSQRIVVWLISLIFLCAFGFSEYLLEGNYNFLTPYVSQATWGFAGLLLTIVALQRAGRNSSNKWLVVAGAGSAMTYLCKPEVIIAASGCWIVYISLCAIEIRRETNWFRTVGHSIGLGFVGFLLVYATIYLVFLTFGGWLYALQAVNWVPWTIFGTGFRQTWHNSRFISSVAGLDDPQAMLLKHLKWTAVLGGMYVTLVAAASLTKEWIKQEWARWVVYLAVGSAAVGLGWKINWVDSGRAVNIPAFALAMALLGNCLRAAWTGQRNIDKFIAPILVAVPAALMLVRMILNGRIYHYGFYMMPLAACFLISRMMQRSLLVRFSICGVMLVACVKLVNVTFGFVEAKNLPVGKGRDRLYAFPLRTYPTGVILGEAILQVPRLAPSARSLIGIPESSAFNYHLRIKSPLIAQEWNPDNLGFLGRDRLLDDLRRTRPDVILVFARALDEFGAPYFGYDERSGMRILYWIFANYKLVYEAGSIIGSPTRAGISIYMPNEQQGSTNLQCLIPESRPLSLWQTLPSKSEVMSSTHSSSL